MDRQWTEHECLDLIDLYRSHDVLWNPKHQSYYKRNLKDDAWNAIAANAGRDRDQVKNKMMSLMASYRREKLKTNKCNVTGKDPAEAYTSRWFAFQALSFLDQRPPKRRGSTDNLEVSSIDEELMFSYADDGSDGSPEEIRCEQTLTTLATPHHYSKRVKREEPRPSEQEHYTSVFEVPNTSAKTNHSLYGNEEIKAFFNYVTTKVQKYSTTTWRGVERDIFEILVKADRGHYE